jgi:hypothetical protein
LCGCRRQFEVSNKLHNFRYRVFLLIDQPAGGFPPSPKGGGLQPQFL